MPARSRSEPRRYGRPDAGSARKADRGVPKASTRRAQSTVIGTPCPVDEPPHSRVGAPLWRRLGTRSRCARGAVYIEFSEFIEIR